MQDHRIQTDDGSADSAIERVLAAEAAARDQITQCRGQALKVLREARADARALSQRSDRRIGLVRRLSDATLKQDLAAIAEESRALTDRPHLTPELEKQLDLAIERLIGEILE